MASAFKDLERLLRPPAGPGAAHGAAPAVNDPTGILTGEWVSSQSEHVARARYSARLQRLDVVFRGVKAGRPNGASYEPVTAEQALDFAAGGLRNGWIWDHMRRRGTKHGHQVNHTARTF